MIKAAIFDLDGTILDTLSSIAHYANIALGQMGLEPIDVEKFKYFAGDGRTVLVHRFLAYRNADTASNHAKAVQIYDSEYEKDVIYDSKPFDGIYEVLSALKKSGVKLAVFSNKPDNVAVMVVDKMLPALFDICWGKKENINTKPDPMGVHMILDRMGIDKKDAIFIGDTNVDINTAKNAQMKSVGVLWGFRDEAELKNAGADFIISKPSELLDIILQTD